ncbi:MAG TPA: BTAD domain-containing putative transcriptional regulator [Blastocatellia bacterium]|nr:BTAD domain-containing putative transcriptional regulator [Blastocatellia bacterium]
MQPERYLRTKLLPPRPARRVLARPRLLARLHAALDLPATIVCADAGCGKTTLVADFTRGLDAPCVWYQLDPSDYDLAAFFAYLTHGLRQRHPRFGAALLALLAEGGGAAAAARAAQLVEVFVGEVGEHVEEKTVLVLDDYHHVGGSLAVAAAVDRLLWHLPDALHVVLTTRAMPNLAVTRLRSKGLVEVVDRRDLLFTPDEVHALFAEVMGQSVNHDLISQFHQRTEGWITGLQLIAQTVEQRGQGLLNPSADGGSYSDESAAQEILRQSEEEIFDYFAEEVFRHESPETQDTLLRLSVFKRIDLAAARCALTPEHACEKLAALLKRNLFISRVDADEQYCFHPMFRRFLRRRLKAELGESGVRALQKGYGDQFMRAGEWQRAKGQYAAAGDMESVARILVERGREMLDAGLFETIKKDYEAVAAAMNHLHPEIIRIRAHIAHLEGDLELTERLLTRSISGARDVGDARCESASLVELASVLIRRGELARARAVADEAQEKAPGADVMLRARCQFTIGDCQYLEGIPTGEFEEAIASWKQAAQMARRAGEPRLARIISHNIGLPFAHRGDFAQAREWFSQPLGGNDAPYPQQAAAYCNLARADLFEGKLESCQSNLEKAFETCQMFNLTIERAEACAILGNLHRERGDYRQAREQYLQAETLLRESGIPLERGELPDEQIRLLIAERNWSQARAAAEALIEKRERLGLAVPLARARRLLGQVMVESGSGDAREIIAQALDQFAACRSQPMIAQATLLLARAEFATGDGERATQRAAEAIRLAREMDYAHWLKAEILRSPAVFHLAMARRLEADYLQSLGVDPQEAGGQSSPAPLPPCPPAPAPAEADLTINLLGPVEILREQGRPLAPGAWALARALRVLCFIATRPNRRATKDTLVETFWADAPLEDIDKNFWPTISLIRRGLNSNQPVKKNFIRYREGAYYLNPEFNYSIDTEEFERLLAQARALLRAGDRDGFAARLRQAIALYRGDLLQDFHDDWVEEPRAYYRNLYFGALKDLADDYYNRGDDEQAIKHYQMILSRDPFREDVHRQMLEAYARAGNRAALREQYETLQSLLMEELGVSPLPETVETYKRLMRDT